MDDDAIPVSTRIRRSTPYHDAYTVRVHDARFASLATARPADARRWVATTRWLHGGLLYRGRLIVGLGVQWTPPRAPLHGYTPVPATLQLCVGHRCLVFHLARADAVPEALRRFLADPRVTFVGSGAAHDARMLWDHYGLDVAQGKELRAAAGLGRNASVEQMADRFLGYHGICKPRDVAMSAWHAPRLSLHQVQYAAVDAYLAFRLGVVLLSPGAAKPPPRPARAQQRAPVHHVPAVVRQAPAAPRALVAVHDAPPVQRAPAVVRRQAPAAPVVVDVPTIFVGAPVTAAVGGDAAISTSSKVRCTHAGDSGTESEMYSYDDVLYRAATRALRAYASDSDCSLVDSPDGYVRFGAFTDEDDDQEDGNEGDQADEQDCSEDHLEDGEGLNQNEVVIHGCVDDDALAQDGWYDQEVDYGFHQEVDVGCDQEDEEEEFEEFYLL